MKEVEVQVLMKLSSGCVCVLQRMVLNLPKGFFVSQLRLMIATDASVRLWPACFLGAREMTQWLREVALAGDLDSISSTLMAAHSHL